MAYKGIEKTVARFCVQTAIYWGRPQPDGFGGQVFDAPVEIKVRWDTKAEIKMNNTGSYFSSSATILTNYEVEVEGYMLLGSFADFVGEELSNPKVFEHAQPIIQLDKIPMVRKTDEFVRVAYLFDYGK